MPRIRISRMKRQLVVYKLLGSFHQCGGGLRTFSIILYCVSNSNTAAERMERPTIGEFGMASL